MLATDHNTYEEYVAYNRSRGYASIPQTLWVAIKQDEEGNQ